MTHPTMQRVVIHCKPSILSNQNVKNGSLYWEYSKQFKDEEIDVFVTDEDNLDEDELCELHGIDYNNQVNCVELLSTV
jgi:hypothetical protein